MSNKKQELFILLERLDSSPIVQLCSCYSSNQFPVLCFLFLFYVSCVHFCLCLCIVHSSFSNVYLEVVVVGLSQGIIFDSIQHLPFSPRNQNINPSKFSTLCSISPLTVGIITSDHSGIINSVYKLLFVKSSCNINKMQP